MIKKKTALIYHKDYLLHNATLHHPERKERLIRTLEYFKEKGIFERISILTPDMATEKDLLRVHTMRHVEFIKNFCFSGGGFIDADTFANEKTYEIAKLAAGGVMLAANAVANEKFNNSFALVRPPGHHACSDRAMGFCYFNNVAIAIRYLQEKFSIKKIFLVDWDVHAANGTMEIFYDDPTVLNVSLHQDPKNFYPGTGFIEQIGVGRGEGYTVNIPMQPNSGNSDYLYIFHEFILPLIDSFKPELIVISAGQDSHKDDPLGSIKLTEQAYGEMTSLLRKKAEQFCNGKIFVELEGGYNLEALAKSNYEIVLALLGEFSEKIPSNGILSSTKETLKKLKEIFSRYHKI
ncbi:MAG: histone deacetylase [Candidatus Altiarchaeota archaeon]